MVERQDKISEILGPQNVNGGTQWRYELQQDTIKDVHFDSIAVKTAIELGIMMHEYRCLNAALEELFPEGKTKTTVGKLTDKQLGVYKKIVALLPEIVRLRAILKGRITTFKPVFQSVIIINTNKYGTKHYFFFNEDNELVCHFLDENSRQTEEIFEEFTENDSIHTFYLSSLSDAIDNIDNFTDFDSLYEKTVPLNIDRYVFHCDNTTSASSYTSRSSASPFPAGANIYVVKKQTYVTTTKDGYNRLIEYANSNDLSSIDYMVLNGEVGVLNPGDEVMMLDCGFAVSKVKNKDGQIVFVDTGSIKSK